MATIIPASWSGLAAGTRNGDDNSSVMVKVSGRNQGMATIIAASCSELVARTRDDDDKGSVMVSVSSRNQRW